MDKEALWDARVERCEQHLPGWWLRKGLEGVRAPRRGWLRVPLALLLVAGGFLSILPVLGLWMLPLGLAFLAEDIPALKPVLEGLSQWLERAWRRLRWTRTE